jgi:hypothetical protein
MQSVGGPGTLIDRALVVAAHYLESAWGWEYDVDVWRAHNNVMTVGGWAGSGKSHDRLLGVGLQGCMRTGIALSCCFPPPQWREMFPTNTPLNIHCVILLF